MLKLLNTTLHTKITKQLAATRTWRNVKPCLENNVKEKQYLKLYLARPPAAALGPGGAWGRRAKRPGRGCRRGFPRRLLGFWHSPAARGPWQLSGHAPGGECPGLGPGEPPFLPTKVIPIPAGVFTVGTNDPQIK